MTKVGIDCGHNCKPDIGAVGIDKEDKLTRNVGNLVMESLRKAGYAVVDCTPTKCTTVRDSLAQRARTANSNRVDYFASIHFNAFKEEEANGAEVFAISKKGKILANSVLRRIVSLGFRNRGTKNQAFQVLRQTNMPAVLIECCFLTNEQDMERFNEQDMAEAITKGLIEGIMEIETMRDADN